MLDVKRVPQNQWPERTKLMQGRRRTHRPRRSFRAARAGGHASTTTGRTISRIRTRSPARRSSSTRTDRKQGTCVHLGNCDIGCDVGARNTLDLNYLARAEQHGAEVRPLAPGLRRSRGGRRLSRRRSTASMPMRWSPGRRPPASSIVGAGSLGSTELLLRCRDQHGTLPNLSAAARRSAGAATATS